MSVGWCSVVLVALLVAAAESAAFVNGDGDKHIFTNDWAVEVFGGPAVANAIAKKHGFENRGQVSRLFLATVGSVHVRRRRADGNKKFLFPGGKFEELVPLCSARA